jgi:hypothetical protein
MRIFIYSILAISLFATGCLGPKKVSNMQEMKISFSFDTEGCALNSPNPEIKVENIPEGTTFFQVSMKDLDVKSFNHGGGTVENDGSGIIGKGSLKGYKGPCPPSGSHTYEFTVRALNADKSLVLGEGKARSAY